MITIRPSIASSKQLNLEREISRLGRHGSKLHIDYEDGSYVDNVTFGMKTIKEIIDVSGDECDVHIIAKDPLRYVDKLAELGAGAVAFQIELAKHPSEVINRIKRHGMKAGLVFDYVTTIESLYLYADMVDYCLFMTSEMDDRGQIFRAPALEKIRAARALLPGNVSIWADGGVSGDNLLEVVKSGADTIVMGRAVFEENDPEKAIENYYKIIGESL